MMSCRWETSKEGREWAAKREKLPVSQIRSELLLALERGDLLVVSGDTGCGKTTQVTPPPFPAAPLTSSTCNLPIPVRAALAQVPQYLLESEFAKGRAQLTHIICTQPRRIAAVSVAERVAVERGEPEPGRRSAPAWTFEMPQHLPVECNDQREEGW